MLINNRVIFSDNGTLIDISAQMADYLTGTSTIALTAAQDYIFIGSELPFNHRFFQIGTANSSASVTSVEYWNGTSWKSAVDVVDQTTAAGKCFAQSGIIQFTPQRSQFWQIDDTVDEGNNVITGLSGITIYDLYWIRMSFSGDFSGTTSLKYIGYKFAGDSDLAVQYPDLVRSDVYTEFSAGKTNWDEQMISCSELIIRDLKSRGIILSGDQILDSRVFTEACIHKCAELIFTAFGKDYEENRRLAIAKYNSAMKLSLFSIDNDRDGRLDPIDRSTRQGWTYR